jgi:hypothetical protein
MMVLLNKISDILRNASKSIRYYLPLIDETEPFLEFRSFRRLTKTLLVSSIPVVGPTTDGPGILVSTIALIVLGTFLFCSARPTQPGSTDQQLEIVLPVEQPVTDQATYLQTGAYWVDFMFLLSLYLLWYNIPWLDWLWSFVILLPYGPTNAAMFWPGSPGSSINWAILTAQWGSFFSILLTSEVSPMILGALKSDTPFASIVKLYQAKLGLGTTLSPPTTGLARGSIARLVEPIVIDPPFPNPNPLANPRR